jgi:hypothetical protein
VFGYRQNLTSGKLKAMESSQIDAIILSTVGQRWIKVAMAISKVARVMYGDLPDGDEPYETIHKRIENLVRAGRLLAQGDIRNWRHSEIRLQTDERKSN